ncbi:hypothetical protein POM88_015468 [Heracleum sosnowskyi]|uniref:Uncharacterized protein n=1 Tax=Heracleum sosnowskyi TaxID=360622 RepID=A0AAD8IKC0_9APIA|nr:hypothetical protein POM88_015468 [Heracleum sosnowskyi]
MNDKPFSVFKFSHCRYKLSESIEEKRIASNVENLESATTGQGTIEGKKHYTIATIATKISQERFALMGAEVYPHKSNHTYRVMTTSKRLADRKVQKFEKNIKKRVGLIVKGNNGCTVKNRSAVLGCCFVGDTISDIMFLVAVTIN